RLKDSERQLEHVRSAELLSGAGDLAEKARDVGGVRLVTADVGEVSGADALRTLVLNVRDRLGQDAPAVVVLAGVAKERPVIVAATNAPARQAGAKAGDLVRAAARALGGGGGGKDDIAQGGGTDVGAIVAALDAVSDQLGRRDG